MLDGIYDFYIAHGLKNIIQVIVSFGISK